MIKEQKYSNLINKKIGLQQSMYRENMEHHKKISSMEFMMNEVEKELADLRLMLDIKHGKLILLGADTLKPVTVQILQ